MKAANKHWKTSPDYKVGDLVWLLTKNIYTKKLSKKLDNKQNSLYKATKLVKLSYQLELSKFIKLHNIFYTSLLRPAAKDLLLRQHNDSPPLIFVNDKKE